DDDVVCTTYLDLAGGRADLDGADFQDHEVADDDARVDVGAELEQTACLDRNRIEVDIADQVVGHGRVGPDRYDVASHGQPTRGPGADIGPGAAVDADDGGVSPEIGDVVLAHVDDITRRGGCGGGGVAGRGGRRP